jgi:hypothetical protein
MENTKNFDLVIIGTGAAASTIAYKCNAVGWKIAVVDSRPFGGTCALRGCDPKKVLVGSADVIDANYRMKEKVFSILLLIPLLIGMNSFSSREHLQILYQKIERMLLITQEYLRITEEHNSEDLEVSK